jgi:LemA protein
MKTGTIVLIVVVLALLLGGCEFVHIRNGLVQDREAVNNEWSQVDTALQFRADLIPNLVETVKGYTKEETSVFETIANARASLQRAGSPQDKMAANNALDMGIGRLLAVVENYPNLKASENYRELMRNLDGAENRILQARRRYNDAVRDYNVHREIFPGNIVASMGGFERAEPFKTEPGARVAPKVQF